MIEWLLSAAVLLAFMNGANDNMKGVATLYGSGCLSYRSALTMATVTTALGSLLSVAIGTGLLRAFSAKGIVPDELLSPVLLTAVALGATLTLVLATRLGFPISTTHALVGALAGGGIVASRRVIRTLAKRITPMSPRQGFSANVATSMIVIGASRLGLPVSTTHVSTGGIFGIGMPSRGLRWGVAGSVVGAWILTLPIAAVLGALFMQLLAAPSTDGTLASRRARTPSAETAAQQLWSEAGRVHRGTLFSPAGQILQGDAPAAS